MDQKTTWLAPVVVLATLIGSALFLLILATLSALD
jgi:hypothetical protein